MLQFYQTRVKHSIIYEQTLQFKFFKLIFLAIFRNFQAISALRPQALVKSIYIVNN